MTLRSVMNPTNSDVPSVIDTSEDPLEDAATQPLDVDATPFIQNLLFIFGSFELAAALAGSLSIAGSHQFYSTRTIQAQKNDLFPSPNPLDFLNISSGCIPVSLDAAARQIRWPNWAVLLPEIPSNHRFKTQGVSS